MKQISRIRKSIGLCMGDLKRLVKTPKIYLLMILTLFFLDDFVLNIKNIAIPEGIGITPFVYPVFMSEWQGRMLGLLIMIFLMSDAPFYHGGERSVFVRVSKHGWTLSKILYVVFLSAAYQLFAFFASIAVCMPYIALSGKWGGAMESYAHTLANGVQAGMAGGMYGVISNYEPTKALLMELLISFSVCVLIGLTVMYFNILFNGYAGTILVSALVILDAFLDSFNNPYLYKMTLYLPVTWVDLSCFMRGNISYGIACGVVTVIILVLTVSIFALVNIKIQKIREM